MSTDLTSLHARKARSLIDQMLDGQPPGSVHPDELGPYADCCVEMARAYAQGGVESARRVFVRFAELDPDIAALRASDPATRHRGWTVRELLETDFPEPRWAVEQLLPVGLVVLAGRPKLGKSWLALQIALAVGTGSPLFDRPTSSGRALYLALEDSARRLKGRLQQQRAAPESQVRLFDAWPSLANDGLVNLVRAVDEDGYSLVVVDTISRALGRSDQLDQAEMTVTLGALQRVAIEREITVLLVDHHRKTGSAGAGDVIDDLLGATSKASVADAALGLYRRRGEAEAVLKLSGRDVDDQELAIAFNPTCCRWIFNGDAASAHSNSVQSAILDALEHLGGRATTTQIARWLGKQPSNVSTELKDLAYRGLVQRLSRRGREIPYALPNAEEEPA